MKIIIENVLADAIAFINLLDTLCRPKLTGIMILDS